MTNILKGIGLVITGLVVGYVASVVMHPQQSNVGGVYNQTTRSFTDAVIGDRAVVFKAGLIGPGTNQGSWTNNTGKQVLISASDITMGWTSGVASSTLLFWVSTSTATTVADYARPTSSYMLIDGGSPATSTTALGSPITGTSSPAGKGAILVDPGVNVVFDVQEKFFCKTATGICETATSSNRGIQSFFWQFKGTYPSPI